MSAWTRGGMPPDFGPDVSAVAVYGGGVPGLPGRLAAQEVLASLRLLQADHRTGNEIGTRFGARDRTVMALRGGRD